MPGTVKNIVGNHYGRLTVIAFDHVRNRSSYWRCICDCGNETIVRGDCLKSGNTKSCGCLNHEATNVIHGLANTRLYHTYHAMRQRCYNPNERFFARYGGRGIKVCDEWLNDFQTFASWARSHGYADGLSIDRIDNDGDYTPENCRWVDQRTQNRNNSRNTVIEFRGERKILTEWCETFGVNVSTAISRIRRGWSLDRVFNLSE